VVQLLRFLLFPPFGVQTTVGGGGGRELSLSISFFILVCNGLVVRVMVVLWTRKLFMCGL
jgi:hypothetical protein